jgi:hypothetical protein
MGHGFLRTVVSPSTNGAKEGLLGKIFGLMFPTLFGCQHVHELTRVRGWDKNVPGRLLSALPKRSWLKRLRRLGLEVLISIWHYLEDKSPATLIWWEWRWVFDDTVFKKYGDTLRLNQITRDSYTRRPEYAGTGACALTPVCQWYVAQFRGVHNPLWYNNRHGLYKTWVSSAPAMWLMSGHILPHGQS